MNQLHISKKGGTRETTTKCEEDCIPDFIAASSSSGLDDEGDCIPERITISRTSRSRRATPKTPKPIAGRENFKSDSDSYNSDNDIEPGLNAKNIKMPSLQDTPGQVIEYIKEITSINKALIMKVKSLNGYVHVQNAKEDDGLDKGIQLRKTVKELTEELENYKRSRRRFSGNPLKSGPKFDKTAAVKRNVTKNNRRVTNENYDRGTIKNIKSKIANTLYTQNTESKNGKNQNAGRTETTTVTQKPHETKKPKAVNIPQKTSRTVDRKSKEPAATTKSFKESVVSQNTNKISKSNESSKQGSVGNKILLADINEISKSVKSLKQDSVNKNSLADNISNISKLTERPKQGHDDKKIWLTDMNKISVSKSKSSRYSREDWTARTRTTSSSSIHTEFSSLRSLDRSKESLSTSVEEELSIYSCSSPELGKLMIQKGGQKADKATAVHSTSTPDVPHTINKISSVNSNHTVIKNVKRQGLKLPSLIEYPKINSGSSATPPKIRSSSLVFESPQKRFEMAKKVGAAPLLSLPGLFNPKPPASPRPDAKNIRLPSLSSQTKFYNRQD